ADEGTPSLSSTSVITVQVSDVNDNPPGFLKPLINVYVKENSPIGTTIHTLTTLDSDLNENAKATNSVSVSTMVNINSETGDIYTGTVQPYSAIRAMGNEEYAWIHIVALLCLCDSSASQLSYSISEEANKGTVVGNIVKDLHLNLQYLEARALSIVSSYSKNYFDVNLRTGNLFVDERIDREEICPNTPQCSLRIQAVLSNPMNVHRIEVSVLDINDNSPEFIEQSYSLNISESMSPGERYLLPIAVDADIGSNSLSYSISEEVNKGTVVGNIAKDLNLNIQELDTRDLRIVSSYTKTYFDVNLRTGNIFVDERIDREEICPNVSPPIRVKRQETAIVNINSETGDRVSLQSFNYED
ncbi:hypothetical protein FQN60_010288, partial [Etheostoma spectabile]